MSRLLVDDVTKTDARALLNVNKMATISDIVAPSNRLCRLQTQGNAQESTKGQHKAHKAYYQEVRERENHKRAVTKEHTELDGTRRTRRQLQPTKENRNAGRGSHRKGCLSGRMQERVHE